MTCFSEHKNDMIKIIESNSTAVKTNWCKSYDLPRDGVYEFDLYLWGFTGMNIQSGIQYLPNDVPDSEYIQDNNPNIYIYENTTSDKFYLERIEKIGSIFTIFS